MGYFSAHIVRPHGIKSCSRVGFPISQIYHVDINVSFRRSKVVIIIATVAFVLTIRTVLVTIVDLVYPDLATIVAVKPIYRIVCGIILLLVRTV